MERRCQTRRHLIVESCRVFFSNLVNKIFKIYNVYNIYFFLYFIALATCNFFFFFFFSFSILYVFAFFFNRFLSFNTIPPKQLLIVRDFLQLIQFFEFGKKELGLRKIKYTISREKGRREARAQQVATVSAWYRKGVT